MSGAQESAPPIDGRQMQCNQGPGPAQMAHRSDRVHPGMSSCPIVKQANGASASPFAVTLGGGVPRLPAMNTLGERLASARKRAGLSQERLATVIGLTRTRVWQLENATEAGSIHAEPLLRAAKTLKVDPWWLLTGEGEAPPGTAEGAAVYTAGGLAPMSTAQLSSRYSKLPEALKLSISQVIETLSKVTDERYQAYVEQTRKHNAKRDLAEAGGKRRR